MRNKHLQNPETHINQRGFLRRIGKLLPFLMCVFAFTAVKANPVDMQAAREIGAKFVNGSTALRTTANDLRHVTTYRTDSNVAAFYVFNMANGFVIVAADDCSIPILAYSKEGPFNVDNIPVQMEGYLQVYRKEIQYGIEHRLSGDESTAKQWNMLRTTGSLYGTRSTTEVEPLLSETWNQSCYYNALCPEDSEGPCGRVYAGCVATAMGQIMHYWKYPIVGVGSHTYYPDGYPQQTANFGATTYDWNNMPDNLNSSSSSTQINAVATLLWHCGVAVNMMYSPSGSGAYSEDVPYALTEYFNYSDVLYGEYKYDNASWLSLIKSNLDLGLPIYYSGSDVNGLGGHAFVCDGYDANDYLHFNWGWSGSGNNAYYAVDALNVGNYQFNDYNYALFNIRPQTGNSYQITAEASPAEGGTVTGGGMYYEGRLCTLTAVSSYDYNFVNWTKDGNVVSTDPTFSFMVTEDATYVANFALFEGITIGSGTTTNEYLPSYSYYCYTLSEQIYTSEDLGMAGAITSLAFYNAGETKTREYDIYMVNTEKTYFENSYDWITPTAEDLVFSGTVTMASGVWTTFTLDNPFVYDGTNFVLIVDDNTGSWTNSPHMACRVFSTESMQAMRVYSDGTDYNPFNPTQYQATGTYNEKNQIRVTMESLTVSTPMVNPNPIDLGYRPNGAWMLPYTFDLYNPGYYTTINGLSSTNPYFQLDTEGLNFPFYLGYHGSRDITVNCSTGNGQVNGLLNINYGDNESVQYNMIAHAYTPVRPDVWEKAQTVTSFPYTANLNSSTMSLYNNYRLPPANITDGADAVYKLVFTEDTYLNASVTSGEDGKVALYPEGFHGVGGPDLDNNYTAPEMAIEEWLYYDNGNYSMPIGAGGSQFWWGIKLNVANYEGTKLTKVSLYDIDYMEGEIMIYQTEGTPSGEPNQRQSISLTGSSQFEEFVLHTPYDIDATKPLWIVIHFISGATYPAAASNDTGDPNGRWVSLDNSDWKDLTYYSLNNTWMLRGFVTNSEGRTMAIGGGNRDNLTYDFDDSSMQGWTTFQGSNTTSPHSWITSAEHHYGLSGYGHNASQGFVLSESYITGENYAVTPDNYLVSPLTSIGNGSVLNFWASDADDSYGAEHFSVEISTTSNYNAAAFTSIFETTLLRGQGQRTGRVMRDVMNDGIWYEYNVDLSAYAGQQVYIAFHHFDCYDQWFLAIDDITINSGDVNYSSITNMTVTPGTYYLVASSSSNEWTIEINTDEVPCPEPAFSPSPANYAEVNPNRTIELSWQLGLRTTEYKLMFGTTESCEQTLVDWTRQLGHHYTLPALLDDMTYYWKVVERNDGCSEGVESPVWSFTTRLNPPQNLYVEEDFIMDGSSAVLYWSAPARALLSYNVYQDGILIGNTTDTYYVVEDLTYNMNGYAFYVTGVFDAGESDPSNYAYVYVSGLGTVNGHVYEQDGDTGIENATVSFTGYDEYGYYNTYSFITDANGYYEGSLRAGSYVAVASHAGYQDKSYGSSIAIVFNNLTNGININLDELFYPVSDVVAEYYPDTENPNSPYVKVHWGFNNPLNWLYYDNGVNADAIGLNAGGSFYWGVMFPAGSYVGNSLTKVSMYDYSAHTGNILVYQGGDTAPETLVGQQTYSCTGIADFVEWTLNNPVTINPSQNLWIVLNNNDGQYVASCCTNTGDTNGRWISLDGATWEDVAGYGLDYTWMIRAYVTSGAKGAYYAPKSLSADVAPAKFANRIKGEAYNLFSISGNATAHNVGVPAERSDDNNRAFAYYRVYRTNAYNNGPYTDDNTVLLADNVTDTLLIDVSWQDAEAGVYKWGVSRVYEGNRESEISWGELRRSLSIPKRNPLGRVLNITEEPNAGQAPAFDVPEHTDLPILRASNSEAIVVRNSNYGFDFCHFVLNNPTNLNSYGYSNSSFTRGACYVNGIFYFADNDFKFGKFDPETGVTIIATNRPFDMIEYNPVNGKMYGTESWNGELYEVNPTDGSYTYIATIPSSFLMTFTITNDGRFILCDANDDCIKEYDLETGELIPLIYVDWDVNYGQDFAIDRETNEIYWAALNNSETTYPLIKINLANYTLSTLGYFDSQVSGFAILDDVHFIQIERESAIIWSNVLDKDMYLNNGAVNVTVSLNSGDNPAGTTVSFINLNSAEQLLYPIADITLDNTGHYAWDSFRKGEYEVTVAKDGYVTYIGYESIWDATALNYMLEEIMQSPTNLYVSSTGWAKWNGMGNNLNQITSGETSFTEGFEGSLNGWNVLTVNAAGGHWLHSDNNPSGYEYASHAHGGSGFAMCYSYIDYDGAYDTDSYLYTPQKYDIVNGSTLTFFADNASDSYPESFSVCVATADNPTASDFVTVWSGSAKDKGGAKADVRHNGSRYDNWRSHSVDLSAYAGQSVWIAFHDVNYDMYEVWIDDVELTTGRNSDRHYEYNQVVLTSTQGGILYTENTINKYCQLPVENLVEGNTYHCKVASIYSSGMTEWVETDWVYQDCDNYEGASNLNTETTEEGNLISWTYPETTDDAKANQDNLTENRVFGTLVTQKMPPIDNPDLNFRTTPTAGNNKSLAEALSNRATDAYCICIYGNENDTNNVWNRGLITFSLSDPTSFSTISTTITTSFGLDYCPLDGYYYTYYDYTLYQIDPNTGEIVNQIGINVDLRDGAWDVTTNTMYSISNSMLYRINVNTGEVYSIGNMGLNMIALACDANGQLYAIEHNNGGNAGLYQIDKTTGASTLVGYTGVDSNYAQSAAFDRETGILYWAQSNQSSDSFFSVNTSTGEATLLLAGSGEVAGLSIPTRSGNILGAMVYRDNELVGFTSDNSYLDENETGNHEYSIRLVYSGSAICPDENTYYSMSCPQSTADDDEFHWDVDINEYPFNMTVTGIIQIDGVEQANPNLEIGAFCNGECRGVQRLTYYPQVNRYLVFFMIYGEDGDAIDFMLYDHGTGTETSGCTSHVTFAANSTLGTPFNPHVFNFANGHISQFSAGWNWWSTYIEMAGIDGLGMLENGLGANGISIKSQSNGYTEFYEDYDLWYGSLESINNESSYLVKTSAPCQVTMNGAIAVPSNHPITVDANGWTWIGYPVAHDMDINAALDDLASLEGDMLKSQAGYAEFYDGYGWFGSLEALSSGMGYMYKSTSATPITFTYPNNGRTEMRDNLTPESKHWESNPSAFPFNMTVTAVVELDGEELRSDRYELAAFANGESRGSVRLMYVEPIDRYVAFLTIAGEEAADLSFALYDTETGMEFLSANEVLAFEANATIGKLAEPFVVSFRGTTSMDELANSLRVYPNPVNAGERFRIGLNTESKAPVRVEIVNALGVVVSVETSTQAPASIVAPVTAGVYTLRVTVEGKGTAVRKLVVK